MSSRVRLVVLLLVASLCTAPALAQAVLHDIHGAQAYESVGASLDSAGDVNADGFDDFIVGATDTNGAGGIIAVGSATVYSGQDGSMLYRFLGTAQNEHFGHAVAGVGDVNADGYDDVLVGTPFNNANGNRSGVARVFSGLDGAQLYEFKGAATDYELGWTVAGVGDVNGDRADDFAIGETHPTAVGKVLVHSGADGSTLLTLSGDGGDGFGYHMDGAGDVDADGAPDIIVGGSTTWQLARVYSGADGRLLYTFDKPYPQATWWASAVAGAGDVNADGHADLVIGAYEDSSFYSAGGMARVMSGADGSVLYTFYGWANPHRLGYDVDGAGDVNGDGYDDIVVGVPYTGTPSTSEAGGLLVYSGKDGSVICPYTPSWYLPSEHLGRVVAGAGDVNGDGFADVLAGCPSSDLGGESAGAVIAVSCRYTIDAITPPEVIFNKPTTVTIHGKGFEQDSPIAVRFGGLPATDVTWMSDTDLNATSPIGAEDALVDLEYEQHGLTVAYKKALTFGGAKIDSVFPPNGSWLGGEDILIVGNNFVDDGSISVKFASTPGTVLAVYEPDTIVVRTPAFGPTATPITVESDSGSDSKLSAYAFKQRWVTPRTGGVDGGTLVAMQGDVQPTTIEDTQAWVGGVPAVVVSQTANTISISTPPVVEATGSWVDVLVHNSNGNQSVPKGFFYTPFANASAAGNPFTGYQLAGAVQSSLASHGQKQITLWVVDPSLPIPNSSPGLPHHVSLSGTAGASGAGPHGYGSSVGGGVYAFSHPLQTGEPTGTLAGSPVAVILLKAPLSVFHSPWYTSIGALNPALIGTTVHLQGLITNDGTLHGSYTNVMTFAIQ